MNGPFRLLGFCGLYCGACNHYRASYSEGSHLYGAGDLERFVCRGCRGETALLHEGCDVCGIRLCAEKNGLIHCGRCEEFPCDQLIEFQHDARHIHHLDIVGNLRKIEEKGPSPWLEAQEERWTCECGLCYSWYEVRCNRCGAGLISYGNGLEEENR
ncbi:MAG: DUF3795 domain-containing protein [Spirochaetes bacterium]|nr:DUF3795 domain-containing protein [Spirochaetota bacterium]